jgi:hypothetical protein
MTGGSEGQGFEPWSGVTPKRGSRPGALTVLSCARTSRASRPCRAFAGCRRTRQPPASQSERSGYYAGRHAPPSGSSVGPTRSALAGISAGQGSFVGLWQVKDQTFVASIDCGSFPGQASTAGAFAGCTRRHARSTTRAWGALHSTDFYARSRFASGRAVTPYRA